MNKQYIIVAIIIILLTVGLIGCVEDNILWEKAYDGMGDWDRANAIAIDPSGNIYVAGYAIGFLGTMGRDLWIKKFYPNGNEDTRNWNNIYGKPDHVDEIFSITTDASGNVYAVGYESDLVNPELARIKKFYPNGNEDTTNWNKTFGGNSLSDRFYSVALDSIGNVYVLGSQVLLIDGQDDSGEVKTTLLIKKFDPNGNEDTTNWNKTYDSEYSFLPSSIALDNDNNVYVTGYTVIPNNSNIGEILKFDSNNNLIWKRSYNWLMFEGNSFSVATDDYGNIYVGGYISIQGESPTTDWWIKKFDSEGNEDTTKWNKTLDGNGGHDFIYSIATDTDGNVYVAGNGVNLIGLTGMDWWIKKFDSEGKELWDKRYDGNGDYDVPLSLAVGSNGDVYVAGGGTNLKGSTQLDWWIKKIV